MISQGAPHLPYVWWRRHERVPGILCIIMRECENADCGMEYIMVRNFQSPYIHASAIRIPRLVLL